MARNQDSGMFSWPSLSLEGNLIAPAMVARIDRREAPEQDEVSYGVRKGLTIREEISLSFRVGQAHFDAFARLDTPSAEATRRFALDFLRETFGFDDLADASGLLASIAGGRVPVVVVPPSEALDRRSPTLSIDRSRSPAIALQDYLNEREDALWGIATNGVHLRLLRDNASLTRPAHIEADLAQIFANEDAASFAALWLIVHRSRFGSAGSPAADCALERWRETGAREGEAARDRLAGQVEIALRVLGSGFLEANPGLAARLRSGELPLMAWFNELLRLVYRLIFLMVAEDRDLLHPASSRAAARWLYAEGYSLALLRAQSARGSTWDSRHDRYEGMKVVFRALADGEASLALPALGDLFDADQLPRLASARLRNSAFMEAVYRLSWLSGRSGIVPVNWRAMETEELGSVYESLLELQPQLADGGRALVFASDLSEKKGHQRKTTGSYYTPQSLVQSLLDTALDPVLDRAEAATEDPAKALLELAVIDPACGSGHFLLAAARRIATRLARIRAEGTPSLADFRHALRDVARCCIHGVDRNPMAVELAKVALWIETVDPGRPLGFFDAQIRCGDALLGVFDRKVLEDGVPDAAYKPLTGDDKPTARYYLKANRDAKTGQGSIDFGTGRAAMPAMKPLAAAFSAFRELPEDTVEQVGARAARYGKLRRRPAFLRLQTAADLYVAAFLLPKTGGAPASVSTRSVPVTDDVWRALGAGAARHPMADASQAARRAKAFHWPLEFPDVMDRGGFDVVLGNPPWEQIQLDPREYFASRYPDISDAPNMAARERLIGALKDKDPVQYDLYQSAIHDMKAYQAFIHKSQRFPTSSFGRLNTAPLFAEFCNDLICSSGRVGIIVPTGIATDSFNQHFFNKLIDGNRLAGLVDFENREAVFPGVHRSYKFCLLTLSGAGRPYPRAEFAFFLHQAEQLGEKERRFTLSAEDFDLFNPNTRTCPIFRTGRDMEIARKMYRRAGVFWKEAKGGEREVNPWGASFQLMFMMNTDSHLFRTREQLQGEDWRLEGNVFLRCEERYLPLYEAKLFHQYDHRFATFEGVSAEAVRGGNARPMTSDEKADPRTVIIPRYWVPEKEVQKRLDKSEFNTYPFLEAEPSRAEPSRAEPSPAHPSPAQPRRA
ncbi:MAG: N-6 DNA methylase, partial [Bryobacterales bacterium]|nr:N-6 DNA methylase [Bryobacterales bacterium]